MFKTILKRDGRRVLYNENKIANAIHKSLVETNIDDIEIAAECANSVRIILEDKCKNKSPKIEEIQNACEQALMQQGYHEAARRYILYRENRTAIRESNSIIMKKLDEIIQSSAIESDMKRDNANVDGDTAMGSMLQIGGATAKEYYAERFLTEEQRFAHKNGDMHIHDFDFYALTETCCQIDILKLFKNGFSTGHGHLREPNSIQSYAALAAIAIQANQNDQHGGQSIPNYDYGLAPGVAKTYIKNICAVLEDRFFEINIDTLKENLKMYLKKTNNKILNAKGETFIKSEIENLLNNTLYVNREENINVIISQVLHRAYIKTDKDTYQASEGFIHNLNTMHSRAGAQTPFSSINYGMDLSEEGRLVIKNILLATEAGLGSGETPIFPIQIFRVKEGYNYNPEDKNYDLFKLACRVSSKRLFPNFSFLDTPYNLQYWDPEKPETEIAYMGCRTRVVGNFYDPSREQCNSRGNLSFTSINLPRLAIESNKDINLFYEKLKHILELSCKQIHDRFEIQSHRKVKNYPFLMGQGIWLDSEKLSPEDEVGEVLKHGTLSIGFIGLAETLVALYGHHHGEGEEYQEKGLEIVGYMRTFLDELAEKTKLNYSLLATPAEGLSGRFVKIDREKFGIIEGVTDRDYYTNSSHIPVHFPISAYEKIKLEAPYHALENAGHIAYVELDGNASMNLEAFETIIRAMHDLGVGYGSINHPVDRCPCCGYNGIIGEECPHCGHLEDDHIYEETIPIFN